ncbi:hypothetical protein [Vibrio sp. 10N]|uniref:hypothetical protein n=1 Tax=Vibrio sp. 10N TaxID=3058938 RepID=UPI0030C67B35
MKSGEQQGQFLLRLSCDTLLFTLEFLQSCAKGLDAIEPDQVVCENSQGIFKDFGNGFYAYYNHQEDEQTLVLKCRVGSAVLQVLCPIETDKVMVIPAHLELPCIDTQNSTLKNDFVGYSMLSDGTAMIPLDNLCRSASQSVANNEKLDFVGVHSIEAGYCCDVTPRYLLVYPNQISTPPRSELCQLILSFQSARSKTAFRLSICLDLSHFSNLLPSRVSLSSEINCIEQKELTQLTPSVASPIAFVDSVFCLEHRQLLLPQADGSFIDLLGKAAPSTQRSFVYSICDGVEHVATGIVVASSASLVKAKENRPQANTQL